MQNGQPDLIWVMTDQQRYDHVGWFPGAQVQTPTLDRLAAEGVIFDNCYSGSTTCVPARTSLLTGLLDHRAPYAAKWVLAQGTFTMPRALRAAGYQTALIGKMHFTPFRADHGFEHLEVSEHFSSYPGDPTEWGALDHYHDWLAERGLPDWRFEVPGGLGPVYPYPIDTHPTSWVRDRTLDFLAHGRDRTRPLLLVVSFPHPHPALNPPEPYASLYDPASMVVDPDGGRLNDRLPASFRRATAQEDHPHRRVHPERLDHHRAELARTLGLITQIDDAVADVVAQLDLTRALVWFTSDHGDYGARRGLVRKVPWIPFDDLAKVPGFATGGLVAGGRREPGLVQSFDLATTFLDAAGLLGDLVEMADPATAGVGIGAFDGVSQLQLLADPTVTADPDRMVWSAVSMGWPMVRRGPHKYIRETGWGQEALFDVVGDPDETLNFADHPLGREPRDELAAAVDRQLAAPLAVLPPTPPLTTPEPA